MSIFQDLNLNSQLLYVLGLYQFQEYIKEHEIYCHKLVRLVTFPEQFGINQYNFQTHTYIQTKVSITFY